MAVLGYDFLRATTLAKLANLTTNLAAMLVFAASGNIPGLVLLMGMANLVVGCSSRTALKNGNAFVRKVFLVVVGGLALKLAWDTVVTFWPAWSPGATPPR